MASPGGDPDSPNLPFVERLYAAFLCDPASVSPEWRSWFEATGAAAPAAGWRPGPSFPSPSLFRGPAGGAGRGRAGAPVAAAQGRPGAAEPGRLASQDVEIAALQDRVDQLVRAYRVRGHMAAHLDPLGIARPRPRELDPDFYGLTESDLDRPFSTHTLGGPNVMTLRQIVERLRNTYCRSIGVQFMHIDDPAIRTWLQDRMEGTENRLALTRTEQVGILTRLTDAVIFEEFVQKKYVGAKSFSLEGAESLIPLLDLAIEKAGDQGISEVVLAMAHRGRLNVLANIVGKSPREIFREFEDLDAEVNIGRGDVKYHLGYGADRKTASGRKVHVSLCFNPSHLEYVNPVALGRLRAKQDRLGDAARERGLAILIHGDAAFAGEGITQETLNLGQLRGYATGGALHVIVNNQIGFTTLPEEGRSCPYASDVARMLQSPVFHVNGEDPEAVAQAVRLAMEFRREFRRDVVVDMYCYRRRGHNEGDEPSFTQPMLYKAIERRKPVREGYLDHLLTLGGVDAAEADAIAARRREHLEKELSAARSREYKGAPDTLGGIWKGYHGGPFRSAKDLDTGLGRARLAEILERLARVPADFHPHPKIAKLLDRRRAMAAGGEALDWAAAETLAYAVTALEGRRVRLSGQDAARGTFSHRHAVLHDIENGRTHMPLAHLDPAQAPVEIHNSPLCEAGVLGFEYGYSLDTPDGLVLWEAQFGDFWNCAQVVVDQFIASAEDKWQRLSGLVLLLPHGFEGMGPEHSHARVERFLLLAADDNLQVVNPTTPAQMFHVLRRQVAGPLRKPLVVMTPKSLLRHPRCVSPLEDLSAGRFRPVLPDPWAPGGAPARILLCSGKLFYELFQERETKGRTDLALVRLEQLYPLDEEALGAALRAYPDGTPAFWVQEEPENMGAWRHLRVRFGERLLGRFPFAGIHRPASASPATGSHGSHVIEQRALLQKAFGEADPGGGLTVRWRRARTKGANAAAANAHPPTGHDGDR